MIRIGKKEKSDKLYQAILQLKDPQECYDFFQDLCTVSELRSMEQRLGCVRRERRLRQVSAELEQVAAALRERGQEDLAQRLLAAADGIKE